MTIKLYDSPFHATESAMDAEILIVKSTFCGVIRDIIEENGWSQHTAAKILGVSQPRVSDVVNGKVSKITLDRLLEMLDKLGYRLKANQLQKDSSLSLTLNRTESTYAFACA